MRESVFTEFIQNVAILLAFGFLYDYILNQKRVTTKLLNNIFLGFVTAVIAIFLMLNPWNYLPGITFDTRTILLLTSGLFFGPIPTIIATFSAAIFRIYIGGAGIYMGVATIIIAGGTGIVWNYIRRDWYKKKSYKLDIFFASLIVHSGMLLSALLLPKENISDTLKAIALPVMLIYTSGTVLLGMIMMSIYRRNKEKERTKLSESIYNSFINANSDIMFVKDNMFRYIVSNEANNNFLKRKEADIIGQDDDSIMESDELARECRRTDELVISNKKPVFAEQHFGSNVFEIKKFPITLANGETGVGGIIRDVSDNHKKRNLQQALFNISKIPYGSLSLRIFLEEIHKAIQLVIKCNNFYIAMYDGAIDMYRFPYYKDEYDNYESDEPESLKNSLTDIVRITGKGLLATASTEDELRKKFNLETYGEYSPVWLGVPFKDAANRKVLGVIAIQDYHNEDAYNQDDLILLEIIANNIGLYIERFENIRQLKIAKERAENSDRLKTSFLANISHEIRTPMNGILGFANILKETIAEEELKEYADIICKSSERLLSTINDVIDIAKIESGQLSINNEQFCLKGMVDDLISFFAAHKRDIQVIYSPDGIDSPLICNSDKIKIYQILNNLISNAVKFTQQGKVEVGIKLNNKYITIFVSDTGIGIAQENLDAIFERFSQVESGSRRKFEGTGLGLSIAKVFANLLGGEIKVSSQLGKGSLFSLILPSTIVEGSGGEENNLTDNEQIINSNPMGITILIAEDDPNNFFYLKVLLKGEERTLLHAKNGREAVDFCKNHPEIDIILMDIKMPEMDGLEATKLIREFRPDLPIIAQTAYALSSDRERVLAAGCNDYIAKPIKRDDLLNLLKKYITIS